MLNERSIALRKGGTFSTLDAFLDRRIVKSVPFVVTQELAVSSAQSKLIPSTILAGTIGVGVAALTNGSYIAAALPGAVGTAATSAISDSLGNVLNLVQIRDPNGDPIEVGIGASAKTIYGLIQCSSTVVDGDSIGGVGSENLQISFVYYNAGVITLTTVNESIQFQANKLFTQRNAPVIEMEAGNPIPDIMMSQTNPIVRKFIVTTAYAANEVITLSTGNGASAGRSTASGDTITLPASDSAMVNDNTCRIRYNGCQERKGSGNDFVWDSTTTGHFTHILDIGDYFEVERIMQS